MATDLTPIKTRAAIDDMCDGRFDAMAYGWDDRKGNYRHDSYTRQAAVRLATELRGVGGAAFKGNEPVEPYEAAQAAKVLAMLREQPYNGWSLTRLARLLERVKPS